MADTNNKTASDHGITRTGPAQFGESRLGLVDDWINKGPSVGARQQRAEALEHFLGKNPGKGTLVDKLLSAAPGSMRAALARAAYRRKAPGPLRNEALAHFYGGWKANRKGGILGKLNTGLRDMQYAMETSPEIKKDFHNLARNAILGGAGLYGLKKMMGARKQPDTPKLAAMNTMESQRLLRRLKMARGRRGGSQMLRLLEARLITDLKQKAAAADKKKTKKKKTKKKS